MSRADGDAGARERAAAPSSDPAVAGRATGPLGRALPLVLPASAAGAALLARAAPEVVEARFARAVYPAVAAAVAQLSRAWASVCGAPPDGGALTAPRASLGEVAVAAAALAVVVVLARAARRRGPVGVLRAAGVLLGAGGWAFLLLWGFNYARLPLARSLDLTLAPVAAVELEGAADDLAAELSRDLDALVGPAAGAVADGPEVALVADDVRAALEGGRPGPGAVIAWSEAIRAEPALGWTDRPVLVAPLASRALTSAGISGVFGPFTQECHVAAGLPALDRGFVACHEIAHAQGWAREDEANYLAYRVGVRHGDAALRVSARAAALRHVLFALMAADRAAFARVLRGLDPRIRALLEARRRTVVELRVDAVATAARQVNDAYLRTNGQDGVASYGRMVDLIVAERRAAGR